MFSAEKVGWLHVLLEKTILFKSYSNPGNFVIGNSTVVHQISAQGEFRSWRTIECKCDVIGTRAAASWSLLFARNYKASFLEGFVINIYYLNLTMNNFIYLHTRISKFNCLGANLTVMTQCTIWEKLRLWEKFKSCCGDLFVQAASYFASHS